MNYYLLFFVVVWLVVGFILMVIASARTFGEVNLNDIIVASLSSFVGPFVLIFLLVIGIMEEISEKSKAVKIWRKK